MSTDQFAVQAEATEDPPNEAPDGVSAGDNGGVPPINNSQRATQSQKHPRVVAAQRSEALNRLLNLLIAVIALVILAPVMLLIALVVKVTSRGPIFYVQDRVGVDRRRRSTAPEEDRRKSNVGGRPFRILKFRSMRQDAEKGTGAVWATQHDPRVTSVGHFLRTTRLDQRRPWRHEYRRSPSGTTQHIRRTPTEHRRLPTTATGSARDYGMGTDQSRV